MMHRSTFEWLTRLHARYGAREFGKLSQKLLAITYRHAGFFHVIERGVQGVDVDAAGDRAKYSTEVKTTVGHAVFFQAKDVAGLEARKRDGYQPILAALRLSPLSNWLLADAEHLEPGLFPLDHLRPYRHRDLEDHLRPLFDAVVEDHAEATLASSQRYLDSVVRQLGIEQRER
jgi:hypothetical protein